MPKLSYFETDIRLFPLNSSGFSYFCGKIQGNAADMV
jgi:hypothetical protein